MVVEAEVEVEVVVGAEVVEVGMEVVMLVTSNKPNFVHTTYSPVFVTLSRNSFEHLGVSVHVQKQASINKKQHFMCMQLHSVIENRYLCFLIQF